MGRLNAFFCMFISIVLGATAVSAANKKDRYTVTGQFLSLAPNAGGQTAYRLEVHNNDHAFYGFNNRALLVGNTTLFGAGYDHRLPVCDESCFWQFFVQLGGGLTNGGGFAQVAWGTMIPLIPIWLPVDAPRFIPMLRVDITTQFYATTKRVVTWSYPLWVGISLAF
jgi:hypothetical protein